ncbi:MAG: hypothetical protein H0T73_21125, partial [Ardenticatenales bacterium]|nr:hypothetical protein [Ardenticatenales bacterium]
MTKKSRHLGLMLLLLLLLSGCRMGEGEHPAVAAEATPALPTAPPLLAPTLPPSPTAIPSATATAEPTAIPMPALRQLTTGGCCVNPAWRADGQAVQFLDKPRPDASV